VRSGSGIVGVTVVTFRSVFSFLLHLKKGFQLENLFLVCVCVYVCVYVRACVRVRARACVYFYVKFFFSFDFASYFYLQIKVIVYKKK
jgi:hypothetical protein